MYSDKNIVGMLCVALNIVAVTPYFVFILRGKNKPHAFTWSVWLLSSAIAAAARDAGNAGAGAWGAWCNVVLCAAVFSLALRYGDRAITRSDVLAFLAALAIIPIWRLTENPLIAVVLVTAIDTLGYFPTFRKTYRRPREETMFSYVIWNVVNVLTLVANETSSWTTMLMPCVLFFVNGGMVAMIVWRRFSVNEVIT